MSKLIKTCKWNESWIGICNEPADESGFCEKHKVKVCVCCKGIATRSCDHTGQFVCGAPLCDNCSHGVPSLEKPGFLGLGGGHHPNEEVEEMIEKEYGVELKTAPEKIREQYFKKTGRTVESQKTVEPKKVEKKTNRENLSCKNVSKPIIQIPHCELTRFGDGIYKSECPVCKKGLLLVGRDRETLILQEDDYCVLCGQRYRYLDIGLMRRRESGG